MRTSRLLAASAVASAFLVACSAPPSRDEPAPPHVPTQSTAKQAVANVSPASASLVSGRLTFVPMGGGVHITGTLGGLTPGSTHAFHVHEKGDCSAVDASSAGGHFNPFAAPHGRSNSGLDAHHAGDMDNVVANGEGVAQVNVHLTGVTLGGGAVNDIADRALVVHASPDDYASQPAGNAGARIACGVIKVTQ